jgi:pimeloyl-ACP methyl ester carboxylesterase
MSDSIDPEFVLGFQQSTLARPIAPDYLELVVGESMKVPAHVWRSALRSAIDYADCPERIAVPACIIWGDRDEMASRAEQLTIAQSLPAARFVAHEGGGHAVHWEDPAGVAEDIAAWSNQLNRMAA